MKIITSTENETFKTLKSLVTAKGRAEHGLCLIEGTKILFENLEHVVDVFVREGTPVTPNLADFEPVVLAKKLFDEISDLDTPCGIIATALIPPNATRITWPALVLDRIGDPGNMGTLIRTAVAFGFKSIIAINCAGMFSQKVIRSAMGQQFKIENFVVVSSDNFFNNTIKSLEAQLLIADMGGRDFGNFNAEGDIALVLGSEGEGVDKRFFDRPHTVLSIPMQNKVESLNVAVAGGILMHQLGQGGMNGRSQ